MSICKDQLGFEASELNNRQHGIQIHAPTIS